MRCHLPGSHSAVLLGSLAVAGFAAPATITLEYRCDDPVVVTATIELDDQPDDAYRLTLERRAVYKESRTPESSAACALGAHGSHASLLTLQLGGTEARVALTLDRVRVSAFLADTMLLVPLADETELPDLDDEFAEMLADPWSDHAA